MKKEYAERVVTTYSTTNVRSLCVTILKAKGTDARQCTVTVVRNGRVGIVTVAKNGRVGNED